MSERNCHWGALNVHGLTRKILSQFRGIAEVVKEFMEYIADSPLLAHNAKFDIWLESGGLKGMGAPAGWVPAGYLLTSQVRSSLNKVLASIARFLP